MRGGPLSLGVCWRGNQRRWDRRPYTETMGIRTLLTTLTLLCGAVSLASQAAVPQARTIRSDKDTEWIFTANKRMKSEGLLIGYPDGLGGNKWTVPSNYELAVTA